MIRLRSVRRREAWAGSSVRGSWSSTWAAWDMRLERDVRAGKLDTLAERALREHGSGRD